MLEMYCYQEIQCRLLSELNFDTPAEPANPELHFQISIQPQAMKHGLISIRVCLYSLQDVAAHVELFTHKHRRQTSLGKLE